MSRWFKLGDRRGNVALIVALCAPIMMLMVGGAIDYGYALEINQRLNEAADTAVLSAISPSIAQGAGSYAIAYSQGNMNSVLKNTWTTNTAAISISPTMTPSVTQSKTNNIVSYTATLSYTASVPTFFAGLVGMSSIPISGHATATTTPLTYIRYYILIDISQSMGIGATPSDMTAMYNRIVQYGQGNDGEVGCVFGCHVSTYLNSGGLQPYPSEDYAHNISPYITLRIDSANSAIQSVIQTAIANENSSSPNISIGLYTMSALSSPIVTQVFAPTTSLSQYTSVAVDLGTNTAGGVGDSDLTDQITYFATNYLPAQGTGASASSPLNYVFLITDGVVDVAGSCTSGHCTSALPSSTCDQLKQKATVGVIYTTYNPIYLNNDSSQGYENHFYQLVYPLLYPTDTLTSNLTACATSPTYFLSAQNGPDIVLEMQTLFNNSLETVRLTQ